MKRTQPGIEAGGWETKTGAVGRVGAAGGSAGAMDIGTESTPSLDRLYVFASPSHWQLKAIKHAGRFSKIGNQFYKCQSIMDF